MTLEFVQGDRGCRQENPWKTEGTARLVSRVEKQQRTPALNKLGGEGPVSRPAQGTAVWTPSDTHPEN